jgi:transposase
MNKLMHKLIMYYEIHRLKREGFKPTKIGRHLVLDYRTVKKYLAMNEEQYLEFVHNQSDRKKLLDTYEDFVKTRLEQFPDASSAQVHDWLKEHFDDLVDVNEKTVFNFVLSVREKHGIPKPFSLRNYARVEELPYGKQAQVDFGEYNMTDEQGKRKKIYFLSMVLSRSRQKYACFRESPFTTLSTIDAHEKCFQHFEGIPEQLVYDQDKLMLVDENKGDLILTEPFRQYTKHRGFKLHFCRKSDPESKGKIENVIKYIKYNFLRGRTYVDIDILNGQALAWLKRTANAKIHATTKKIPHEQWEIEKKDLKVLNELFRSQQPLKTYTVRKDNTISYKSNFYRLPLGTYQGAGTTVSVKINDDNIIVIYDTASNEIVRYKLHIGKGKLIGNNNFKRDYSYGIDQLIDQLSGRFNDPEKARDYFLKIRKDNPRYIRDQLLLIRKMTEKYGLEIMNQALDFCIQNKVLMATDLESVAKKIKAESSNTVTNQEPITVKTMNKSAFKIIPQKSNISDYQNLMN